MIPYITTPYGNISTFVIMITLGILTFLGITHIELRKNENIVPEEIFIFPKILYSAITAYFFSAVTDSIFKFYDNGKFVISGITFYGGLFGGIIGIYIQLYLNKKKTQYSIYEWFNILTQPLIVFHILGRIGCFLAGCCYGKATDSCLGIVFPDNIPANIIHHGKACYPTQLFEVIALIIILIIVYNTRKKFNTYILLYAIARFVIEFFRGDNRGNLFGTLSPAQVISIAITITVILKKYYNLKERKVEPDI